MTKKTLLILALSAFIAAAAYVLIVKKPFAEEVMPLSKSWEIAIPNQEVPAGIASLSAESCGACHTEHYAEWQRSTHYHAWSDKQFQAELKKESSPFMCINCHIPLQNQQEFIVTGLIEGDIYRPVKIPNPKFDLKLQQEAITCASCHVRDGKVIGTFATDLAPHPVKVDPVHLSEKLCISCHNANAVVTPTLACTFETGDEWRKSPYFGEKNCVSCHMPEVERPLMAGFPSRKSHRHWFGGSGIPKDSSHHPYVMNGLEITDVAPKKLIASADSIRYTIMLKNEFAGHRMPTGDPERYVLTNFKLSDDTGKLIAQQTDRIGETWEWYPVAKKLSDNNLEPKEARTYRFVNRPAKAGNYTLNVKVTKHRLSDEAAEYNKLGADYPRQITVFEKSYAVKVK